MSITSARASKPVSTAVLPTRPLAHGRDQAVSGANVWYRGAPVSLKFENLKPETNYIIYYYASTEDRTQYARVTKVNFLQYSTKATQSDSGSYKVAANFCKIFIIILIVMIL